MNDAGRDGWEPPTLWDGLRVTGKGLAAGMLQQLGYVFKWLHMSCFEAADTILHGADEPLFYQGTELVEEWKKGRGVLTNPSGAEEDEGNESPPPASPG
jgi:hypothetical protein